jgi:hypothetical protein
MAAFRRRSIFVRTIHYAKTGTQYSRRRRLIDHEDNLLSASSSVGASPVVPPGTGPDAAGSILDEPVEARRRSIAAPSGGSDDDRGPGAFRCGALSSCGDHERARWGKAIRFWDWKSDSAPTSIAQIDRAFHLKSQGQSASLAAPTG